MVFYFPSWSPSNDTLYLPLVDPDATKRCDSEALDQITVGEGGLWIGKLQINNGIDVFIPDAETIVQAGSENLAALTALCKAVKKVSRKNLLLENAPRDVERCRADVAEAKSRFDLAKGKVLKWVETWKVDHEKKEM